jgi:uncharacterized membrane protein
VLPFSKAFEYGKKTMQQTKAKHIKGSEIMKTLAIVLLIHSLTACIFAAIGIYAMNCGFIKIGAFMAICAGLSVFFGAIHTDEAKGEKNKNV